MPFESSAKLKILSVAGKTTVKDMVIQVIDYVYSIADKKKVKEAKEKLAKKER